MDVCTLGVESFNDSFNRFDRTLTFDGQGRTRTQGHGI